MTQITSIFNALSDPVRFAMVQRLAQGETQSIGVVTSGLGVTRQGARKHLAVLESALVICLIKKGRSTEVKLNKDSLLLVKKFISQLEQQWDQRLLALKTFVED